MNRSASPFALATGEFDMASSAIDGQRGTRRRLRGRLRLPLLAAACGVLGLVAAQGSRAQEDRDSPDPWPRPVKLADASLLIYQPQLESWQGNQRHLPRRRRRQRAGQQRAGLWRGVGDGAHRGRPDPARGDAAGRPDHPQRLPDPARPGRGLPWPSCARRCRPTQRTISLDRMEASLAASAEASAEPVAVVNRPPEIIVSYRPAILIPIDGEPALRPVPGTSYERVINTLAVILRAAERRPVLPPRLRRLARGRCARRRLAAGGATDAGARRRRRAGGQACRGRPAERAWRAADHLRPPHPGRAGRVRRPARLPAGRHHGPALGRQHQVRRAVRQRRQPVLRPGRRPLVPVDPGRRAVELRLQQGPAGLLPRDPDRLPGRGRAADGGRHAAGQGGGDRGLDPAHRHRAAEGRARVHRR